MYKKKKILLIRLIIASAVLTVACGSKNISGDIDTELQKTEWNNDTVSDEEITSEQLTTEIQFYGLKRRSSLIKPTEMITHYLKMFHTLTG